MGEFIESFHCLDPSGSFMEMDSGLELICQFPELNGSVILENSSLELMCYSDENCLSHQPDFSMPSVDNLSSLVPAERLKPTLVSHPMVSAGKQSNGDERKRVTAAPDTRSANNIEASLYSESLADAKIMKKNGSGSGSRKRGRRCSERTDKPREVVHVRARRGQATDSHSLAERVRREKINEKMRRLKGLVPGCYRAMGMAGMLDVIIDYVQSLQNQVGFLSMRLAAASTSYDNSFSLDLMEAVATTQVQKAYLEEEDGLVRDHGGRTSFLSAVPF